MLLYFLVLLCSSGIYAYPTEGKIVNGTDAEAGEIPYIISLRYNNKHTCGGSILTNEFILTAAHCVHGRDTPELFSVQYGVTHITQDDHQVALVESIMYHEKYVSTEPSLKYDIAIIKLKSPIPEMAGLVRPTVLPVAFDATPGGEPALLAGWGLPYTGGSVLEDLQKVDIMVYTDEDCQSAHSEIQDGGFQVCAGVPEGGKGQCNGDSGGPLTVDGVQVGIVSWSIKPCTIAGYPGVFTKVSTYVDWIDSTMETLSAQNLRV